MTSDKTRYKGTIFREKWSMAYRLKIADEIMDVDVLTSDRDHTIRIGIDGREHEVKYMAITDHVLLLIVDGKTVCAHVIEGRHGTHVCIKGRSFFIQDADQVLPRRARPGLSDDLPGEVTPPMPAVVVRILVREGDPVKKGQGLIVLTAMKMETTLVSPKDGNVKKINTSINAKVSPGDILVEIEEGVSEDEPRTPL